MRDMFKNFVLMCVICFTCVAVTLTFAYAKGNLSPRLLGTGFLILVACLFGVIVVKLTRAKTASSEPPPTTEKSKNETDAALKKLETTVLILPVILIIALWQTRDAPLLPRLAGAAVNILFTCYFIVLIRAKKKQS